MLTLSKFSGLVKIKYRTILFVRFLVSAAKWPARALRGKYFKLRLYFWNIHISTPTIDVKTVTLLQRHLSGSYRVLSQRATHGHKKVGNN